jgi:hypothetical protein
MDKYRFDSALLPVSWPLYAHLKKDGNWQLVAADKETALLTRKLLAVATTAQDRRPKELTAVGLMKPAVSAETSKENRR